MPAPTAKLDPTPAFPREVLALFREELADVHFPGCDLAVLEEAEESVLAAQIEVERIEAELEAARIARAAQLAELETKAERALAYARVFASAHPELNERVSELGRKKSAAASDPSVAAKKRTRAKRNADGAELFGDAGAPAAMSGDEIPPVLAS
jgi:hypothetical protein